MSEGTDSYRIHCSMSEPSPGGTEQVVRRCLDVNVEKGCAGTSLAGKLAEVAAQVYPGMRVESYERI